MLALDFHVRGESVYLRGNSIQHLACDWYTQLSQLHKQLPRDPQALVDLETLIDIRIVNQSLPADCCPWLFKIGPHNNNKVIFKTLLDFE